MEKKLSDYLHLYLGCEGVDHNGEPAYLGAGTLSKIFCGAMSFKPILRPLRDMTEEEKKEWRSISKSSQFPSITQQAEEIKWMLLKQFDVFKLIEAGLAVAATLNTVQVSDTTGVQ